MNNNEAIIAMVKEGKKVRQKNWGKEEYLYYYDSIFYNEEDESFDVNEMPSGEYEIFEDPKPKVTYYRTKWAIDVNRRLITDCYWFKTKTEFKDYYSYCDSFSDEWEEMEI